MTTETTAPATIDAPTAKVPNPVTAKSPADGKERLAAVKRRVARAGAAPNADKARQPSNMLKKGAPSKADRVRALLDSGKDQGQVVGVGQDAILGLIRRQNPRSPTRGTCPIARHHSQ